MPLKPGAKKGFFTSNRKKGIITLPFPDVYRSHKDSPRLMGYSKDIMMKSSTSGEENRQLPQCSTLIMSDRNFKKVLIKLLNKFLKPYNLVFQEWDLSACHTKILISLYPEKTPTIRSVFKKDESIWDEFANFFSTSIIDAIGGKSVLKAWSKIVAYKCLQGGSVSYEAILASLGPKGLSEFDPDKQDMIIKCFQENPVLKEFNTLNNFLQDRRYISRYMVGKILKIYHPTNHRPMFLSEPDLSRKASFYSTSNLCRLASQIVVGGENFVLMMALEVLRKHKMRLIPVIYEYDGFLVLVELDKSEKTINELNMHLQDLLKQSNLFEMTFEQKIIG